MKMATLRLAILECQPLAAYPKIAERSGRTGFAQGFELLFAEVLQGDSWSNSGGKDSVALAEAAKKRLSYSVFDATAGDLPYAAASSYDAFLVTGSFASAYDESEWIARLCDFLRFVRDIARRPLLGVCFGHQIIAHAFNGRVTRNPQGLELGAHECELRSDAWFDLTHSLQTGFAAAKTVFGEKFCQQLAEDENLRVCTLRYVHYDHVSELPRDAINLGGSAMTPHQAYYIPNGVAFCVQGHPEFSTDVAMYETLLLENGATFGSDAVARARATLLDARFRTHHLQIARLMLLFALSAMTTTRPPSH